MAFSVRNLSVLAYANGFTLWHYKAAQDETLDMVTEAEFFEPAFDMLSGGDLIMVSSLAGARIVTVGMASSKTRILLPLT